MSKLEALFSQLKGLQYDELKALSERIMCQLKGVGSQDKTEHSVVQMCRKCSAQGGISKYGKDKNGKQRYRCKHCGSVFSETSYSVVSHTHCSLSQWDKYIQALLQGFSIRKCAKLCGISERTAFIWRHKILSVLQHDQDNRMLSGIVEADETFFSISYKGNHKKSKKFIMPRKAYKRGTDSRAQTGSRACVMCAMERNGQFYAEVLGKGQPTIAMLSHAFDSRIMNDSIVISDKAVGMRHYFEKNDSIQHIQVLAVANPNKKFGPPEIKGVFHVQNINNMHARIRKFLRGYNGVSTKYLNHYINLFIWMDNHKAIKECNLEEELHHTVKNHGTYIPSAFLFNLPAIPCIA